jgi:multidrug efflux pump subunit AcrA (membrane-fusion protein)
VPKNPQRFLSRPWARAIPAGVAAILVVAGTAVTHANANASPVDAYRTTAVTTGSVEQRLNLTGTVQRVSQVTQSFAVAGTVTSVAVSVGDAVTAGQPLVPLTQARCGARSLLPRQPRLRPRPPWSPTRVPPRLPPVAPGPPGPRP